MAETSISGIPDQILEEVFWRLPSAIDTIRLTGVCRRLRHLAVTQRNIWRRFESIKLYCDGDIRIRDADATLICQFPLTDETKLRSVLLWLFAVCKPKQLHMFFFHNKLEALVDALPADYELKMKRLKIHLDLHLVKINVKVGQKELCPLPENPSGIVTKLLRQLSPESLTHLSLDLRTDGTVKGIFADWLQKATKLQVLFQASNQGMGLLSTLATLPQLKAVGFGSRVGTELFLSNPSSGEVGCKTALSLSHICGSYPTPKIGEWSKHLSDSLRLNIRSFCCMDYFNPFDAASPEQFFPNCRRIEFTDELSAEKLDRICSDYRKLQADNVKEEERDVLKVFLYVHPDKEQVLGIEQSCLVEIVRLRRYGYNCCAIRREFD